MAKQREVFAKTLEKLMEENKDIFVLTGDLGYGVFDTIKERFPQRFVNCGASEQAMLGIAVGLALKGKIPFVYSITPFLLRRPYETLRLYLEEEKIPVKLVGSGRDLDYEHDGPSHDATDVKRLFKTLPHILQYWPETDKAVENCLRDMVKNMLPSFISLKR